MDIDRHWALFDGILLCCTIYVDVWPGGLRQFHLTWAPHKVKNSNIDTNITVQAPVTLSPNKLFLCCLLFHPKSWTTLHLIFIQFILYWAKAPVAHPEKIFFPPKEICASTSLPSNTNAPIWSMSIEIYGKFLLGRLLLSEKNIHQIYLVDKTMLKNAWPWKVTLNRSNKPHP